MTTRQHINFTSDKNIANAAIMDKALNPAITVSSRLQWLLWKHIILVSSVNKSGPAKLYFHLV